MNETKDEGLQGNEKIEQAVLALQHEPTQEQLAHTLTVLRRRMKAQGQLVAAVEPNLGGCSCARCRPPTGPAGGTPSPALSRS